MPRRPDSIVDPNLLRGSTELAEVRSGRSGCEGWTGAIVARSTVLAVDEDAGMRKFVRRILESAGFGCVEAADGESGLKLAVEAGVSAAIVDLVLSGMSGAELAWRLCAQIPGLPVVAVSGRLDLWDADDLRDLGIREALPKPFEPKRLVRAVADALARPPPRPPSPKSGRTAPPEAPQERRRGRPKPPRRGEGPRRSRRPVPPDGNRLESTAGDEPRRPGGRVHIEGRTSRR